MAMLKSEFPFELPLGYVDGEGTLHRQGVMRMATAADEILPLRDHRVQSNPAYLPIILLSRVITRLGSLDMITTLIVEGLFARDFAYLQQFYDRINGVDPAGDQAPDTPVPTPQDPPVI